jgi:signal transduction histidine kinase
LEVLDRVPRSARATAAVATRLAYFDRDGFLELLRRCPAAVTSNILRATLDRIRDGNDRRVEELLRFERLSLVGEMASAIVHDLRNPLGVIRNVAVLLEEGGGEFPAARMAGMLRRSADHMLGMIEDILDFSRGTSSMSMRPVAVADLLADLEEQALQGLRLRGTQVERRVSAEGELVADRSRLLRALLNIVKNAGEAMPHGGTLRVDVDRHGDAVVFAIADTGGGIPDTVLAKIFDPFVTHGKAAGTGLGLATAKAIVDAHRGRIDVESVVGKGTTFRVAIPCA